MDDFNDSLWGEDDIDEALLIAASQQVEAETVSKVSEKEMKLIRSNREVIKGFHKSVKLILPILFLCNLGKTIKCIS